MHQSSETYKLFLVTANNREADGNLPAGLTTATGLAILGYAFGGMTVNASPLKNFVKISL